MYWYMPTVSNVSTVYNSANLRISAVYIVVAYLPLTVFIIYILFRVSIRSPKLHVVVSVIKIMAIPIIVRAIGNGSNSQ